MISICIPVYNCDVTLLTDTLHKQGEQADIPFEILLIDDKSDEEIRRVNEKLNYPYLTYIPLKRNIGRSRIRNLFLQHAQYDYLLFLDCDSAVISENFIRNYIDYIVKEEPHVIYGGSIYPKTAPTRNKYLRWKYGTKKESQPLHIRNLSPNRSFKTNNFLISSYLFSHYLFDETIVGYGHEDTLFGFHLKKSGICISHIMNPVLNAHLEENEEFLIKTEESIRNLLYILEQVSYDKTLIEDISLLSFYEKLKAANVIKLIEIIFPIGKPILHFFLKKGFFYLWMFDLYKLGILTMEKKRLRKKSPSKENI